MSDPAGVMLRHSPLILRPRPSPRVGTLQYLLVLSFRFDFLCPSVYTAMTLANKLCCEMVCFELKRQKTDVFSR